MPKNKKIQHSEHEHHDAECDCSKDCKCGCQEGKECTCSCEKECCCGCHKGCNCSKKCVLRLFAILIVFLAGMGFNELLHSCCRPCPIRAPHPAPMMKTMPFVDDGGNTIIIINTDGQNIPAFAHHGNPKAGFKHNKKHFRFHDKDKFDKNTQAAQEESSVQ